MKILLYYHAGSKNHGCEAIVRTISKLFDEDELILYSFDAKNDNEFGLNELVEVKQCLSRKEHYTILERLQIRLGLYCAGQEQYTEMLDEKNVDWAFAIGGDNYCYPGQPEELGYLNAELNKRGIKTALIGCSIDSSVLEEKKVIKDLQKYKYIIARESISLASITNKGLDNTILIPDSAFILEKKDVPADIIIKGTKYVGINMSPLILRKNSDCVYQNYLNVIDYILRETNYHIMLIPHVVVPWDNDIDILSLIYEKFAHYQDRLLLLREMGAEQIKGYISLCDYVICSRTHVSIASYSLEIPTLVVGYSVKAFGIAHDLFGESNKYVLGSADLKDEYKLVEDFKTIMNNEEEIRDILHIKVKAIISAIKMDYEKLFNR